MRRHDRPRTDLSRYFATKESQGRTNRRSTLLPPEVRDRFLGRELVCNEWINLPRPLEEDLFARVQMGVRLNEAEKLRAASGHWQALGEEFVSNYPLVQSCKADLPPSLCQIHASLPLLTGHCSSNRRFPGERVAFGHPLFRIASSLSDVPAWYKPEDSDECNAGQAISR